MLAPALIAAATTGLASAPHCAAMCGPLATFASGGARASVRYHGGRLAGYALVGSIAGASGELVTGALEARLASAVLSLVLAASLGVAAYRLWRADERERGLVGIGTRPRAMTIAERAFALAPKMLGRAKIPLVLGVLTALLPCGALYSALLVAAASGSAIGGALAMLVFAAVSGVGLALIGAVASKARALMRGPDALFYRRVLATALIVGAILFAVRPIAALTQPEPSCHAGATR